MTDELLARLELPRISDLFGDQAMGRSRRKDGG